MNQTSFKLFHLSLFNLLDRHFHENLKQNLSFKAYEFFFLFYIYVNSIL